MSEPRDYFDFDASNPYRRLFARNVSLVRRPPRHETAGGSIERAARPDPAGLIVAFSAERERSLREGRQHISRQSAVAATIPNWRRTRTASRAARRAGGVSARAIVPATRLRERAGLNEVFDLASNYSPKTASAVTNRAQTLHQ